MQWPLYWENNFFLFLFGISVCFQVSDKWLPGGSDGKESACNAGDLCLISGLGRSPWWRKWQPTLVFLSGEFHGQRSLAGYSPSGHKESDTAEWQSFTHSFDKWEYWVKWQYDLFENNNTCAYYKFQVIITKKLNR